MVIEFVPYEPGTVSLCPRAKVPLVFNETVPVDLMVQAALRGRSIKQIHCLILTGNHNEHVDILLSLRFNGRDWPAARRLPLVTNQLSHLQLLDHTFDEPVAIPTDAQLSFFFEKIT
jgi:hypothetical protein